MKYPKVGPLCAVVTASVMFCFGCRGVKGLGGCKLCSANDTLLEEPAVCLAGVGFPWGSGLSYPLFVLHMFVRFQGIHPIVPSSLTIALSQDFR